MKKTLPLVDPWLAFKRCYGQKGLFFLDSSQAGMDGKFSYLGLVPRRFVRGKDLNALRKAIVPYHRREKDGFGGGAVGYIAYDGDFCFGIYDKTVTFDLKAKRMTVHAPDKKSLDRLVHLITAGPVHVPLIQPQRIKPAYKSSFTPEGYKSVVRKALDHIRRGDIYQINLSRKIELKLNNRAKRADALAVYAALRERSPSPFAAYFDDGRQIVISSSPERGLRLKSGIAQVKPMKGTRPRGGNKAEDARLKQELQDSPKEVAELLMVTDLERNDLGRVCAYGSVKVKALRTIETYHTVFQATATIEGKLHKKYDGIDLLKAVFPSGSVTGCPKIEAMKVIRELERAPRGLYTGALGYIGFNGDMDFSVIIRSMFLKKDSIAFHVGGGIVADSNPAAEYEETCVKARAMQAALEEVING